MSVDSSLKSKTKTWSYAEEFFGRFGRNAQFVAKAPGRVNLIGEHTDYNFGLVLPMAIDRRIEVWFAIRDDKQVNLFSKNFEQSSSFTLGEEIVRGDNVTWSDYVKGVARVMLQHGHDLVGLDAFIFGDIPLGSGLSSSAAIEVASVLAFAKAASFDLGGPLEIAKLAQQAEREFVGVNCGIMDQFISAAGVERHALKIDCLDMAFQSIEMPLDATIVIGDTKLSRSLAASAYNQRRRECKQSLVLMRDHLTLGDDFDSLRQVDLAMVEASREFLPDELFRRCRHVVSENNRVTETAAALKANDLTRVGELFDASHESLRDDYEVSSDGLNSMVQSMRELPGCFGARLTGAGFGGCAIAIVDRAGEAEFTKQLLARSERSEPMAIEAYAAIPSAGGMIVEL